MNNRGFKKQNSKVGSQKVSQFSLFKFIIKGEIKSWKKNLKGMMRLREKDYGIWRKFQRLVWK